MLLNSNLVKFIVVAIFLTNSSVVFGNDIEKFANKLFNHYEYDDKINKYLKSFFSFGNSKSKTSLETKKNFSSSNIQKTKHIFKIKSKNKMIYSFGDGQSLQMKPSNIAVKLFIIKVLFHTLNLKKDSILYGINIDF